jgi:FixJ family two-component response regulator
VSVVYASLNKATHMSDAPPIFIVDDHSAALNSLRFLLESEGYKVVSFCEGAELLSSLPRPDPACVIIDYKMPAMDGMDLFQHLRDAGVKAPVILVTGHFDPAIRTRVEEAGLDLIEKPLSQDMLLRAVEAACNTCAVRETCNPAFGQVPQ